MRHHASSAKTGGIRRFFRNMGGVMGKIKGGYFGVDLASESLCNFCNWTLLATMVCKVAIAKLKDDHGVGAMQKAFLREVDSLTKLEHPAILRPHGICIDGDELLLVLPLCPRSLFDAYQRDPKSLNNETRLRIMQQLASAVAYLHNHKPDPIVHRDLKVGLFTHMSHFANEQDADSFFWCSVLLVDIPNVRMCCVWCLR
jgi:serine/threonine protein kinase